MSKRKLTRYEQAVAITNGYGFSSDESKRAAKHIFAKMVTGGSIIGKINGKLVVFRERLMPRLP